MTTKYDVLGIGNAIMDIIAPVDDSILAQENITKSGMTLVDEPRALELHGVFKKNSKQINEIAGGSGANTMAGIAGLGVSSAYVGKVANDGVGSRFTKSLHSEGVFTNTAPLINGAASARCLIAVTPDGERSMSTYLGANTSFGPEDVDPELVRASAVTYLEGYLFDTDAQKAAFVKAAEIATAADRKVALTLSDDFCVGRHRASFLHLVENHVDILFANKDEMLSLYEIDDLGEALRRVWKTGTTAAVTRSEKGSVIIDEGEIYSIDAVPVKKLVDTTGAGDQYAAGVLAGRAMGMNWQDAGRLGSLCAAEVISHYGARPEQDIHSLAANGAMSL
jgi:sugar/nucleoside kinase (ribokinase family)